METFASIATVAAVIYAVVVILLAFYGLHSLWLLVLFLSQRRAALAVAAREAATPLPPDDQLPCVLVQLPVFNERDVVTRLVDAIGRLDWPADKLHIQLLDDSTDDSVEIGRAACARLRGQGLNAVSLHRTDRTGYKAGALDKGMQQDDAPFIAIFDADFVPHADFLKIAIRPLLADPGLGLVQGRWGHLNRDANFLTKAQALGIDGHFAIEQGARAWSGLAMNFNGTCGLWRREAIIAGGGWEHDTLTEDMDLSYRSQMAGWRCTYRIGLMVPGEIPASVGAWRSQQFRWAKGSIQTALKLLPRVWRAPKFNLHVKVAATVHMTHYLIHPLMLVSLFTAPFALVVLDRVPHWVLGAGVVSFLVGAMSPILVYVASQFVLEGRQGWRRLASLPALAAFGTGIAVSNTSAVWQAVMGRQSEFVRTPKQGAGAGSYKPSQASGMAELFCATWAALGLGLGLTGNHTWITPLLALYLSGFAWMAVACIRERRSAQLAHAGANLADSDSRVEPALGRPSALPWLIPLGLGMLALAATIGWWPDSWWQHPRTFAVLGLLMGALYIAAVAVVRLRPGRGGVLVWIAVIALAMRIVTMGMVPSPDAARAVVEGRQLAVQINPYAVAPGDPATEKVTTLVRHGVSRDVLNKVIADSGQVTAATPPLSLAFQGLVTAFSSDPKAIKIAALIVEAAALVLVLALLARAGLPTSALLVAAWNPVGPLFLSGEGHLDALCMLLLALSAYLAAGRHAGRALVAASLAALAKPIAAIALLPLLRGKSWRWLLLPLVVATICLLPFISAGTGLLVGLSQFAGEHHHGVLEPFVRLLVDCAPALIPAALASKVVVSILAGFAAAGIWLVLRTHRDLEGAAGADLTAKLIAVVLICLPSLHPWYLAPLVVLLPFTRSWGLVLLTVLAPLYWLHRLAGTEPGASLPWVSFAAHLPVLLVLAWECAGRPIPWRAGPGKLVSPAA